MKTGHLAMALAGLALSLSVSAFADTYRNFEGSTTNHLGSKEGLNITVTAQDYESGDVGASQTNTAEDIKLTVNGANVKFGSQIRAVVTPNCVSGEYHWAISQPTLTTDLTAQTDGSSLDFSGSFNGSVMTSSAVHGGEWIGCQPQLSIVVDGAWQTDPVNGTHNFNLVNF